MKSAVVQFKCEFMKSFNLMVLVFLGMAGGLIGCGKPDVSAPVQSVGAQVATHVSDADVTTNVLSALRKNPGLQGLNINVVTTKGDVQLIGNVNNQAQVDAAIVAARSINGSHAIHNKLVVAQ